MTLLISSPTWPSYTDRGHSRLGGCKASLQTCDRPGTLATIPQHDWCSPHELDVRSKTTCVAAVTRHKRMGEEKREPDKEGRCARRRGCGRGRSGQALVIRECDDVVEALGEEAARGVGDATRRADKASGGHHLLQSAAPRISRLSPSSLPTPSGLQHKAIPSYKIRPSFVPLSHPLLSLRSSFASPRTDFSIVAVLRVLSITALATLCLPVETQRVVAAVVLEGAALAVAPRAEAAPLVEAAPRVAAAP